jgi:hypothetical protein
LRQVMKEKRKKLSASSVVIARFFWHNDIKHACAHYI